MTEEAAKEVHVLEQGEGRVEIPAQPLRHVGNARGHMGAKTGTGHVAAQHLDAPVLKGTHPRNQCEQAGLADPVRANQAGHHPGGDVEVDVPKRLCLAVAQPDALQPHHRGGGGGGDAVHSGSLSCKCGGQGASGSSVT